MRKPGGMLDMLDLLKLLQNANKRIKRVLQVLGNQTFLFHQVLLPHPPLLVDTYLINQP